MQLLKSIHVSMNLLSIYVCIYLSFWNRDLLLKNKVWRGKKSNFTNLGETTLSKCSKIISPMMAYGYYVPPDIIWQEKHFTPVSLFKTHNPSLIMRQTSDKPKWRDILEKQDQYSSKVLSLWRERKHDN